ncbi:LysE family translocator [Oceanibaculum pacificum]|uniref:Lysine transporter LysE n=1 Tax=Oceanibaculum pacificum TaxID=580166 RepID=A0A154WGZ0_9PROT|nr:LysE family translocator [Oceanibaculum pacificum]KZD12777.1 lysine transporter LysE [Oceanibaculum pacificum]
MLEPAMLIAALAAGVVYIVTPGPAVLALLGIGAEQGRRAGAAFLGGHLVGDLLWTFLALLAIIGARVIDPLVFDLLGIACGLYLFYLGLRAVLVRRTDTGALDSQVRHPLRRGMIFGVTNPKGYPVALAMFAALLANYGAALSWDSLPPLMLAAFLGFLLGDLILVWIVGLSGVRRLYRRYDVWIVRVTGLMFIGFALNALSSSAASLLRRP